MSIRATDAALMIASAREAFGSMARDGFVVYRRPEHKPTLLRGVTVSPGDGCDFVIAGAVCGSHFGGEHDVRIPVAKVMDLEAGRLTVQDIHGRVVRFEGRSERYQWLWKRAANPDAAAFTAAMFGVTSTDSEQG